jgi:diadenosine tetraphosphatase ApaH/serine/threonine PP2A family protein phosphatase
VRYLILSDLHANWEALQAALDDTAGQYEEALCCGDLVGYGADPNKVVEWVRANCKIVVRGNHDKACTGLEDLEWFNPVARTAAIWTLQQLTPENAEYIRKLPEGPLIHGGVELFHGAPFDEDEYLLTAPEAGEAFGYLAARVAFFGHTHVQGGFIWNHARVETIPSVNGMRESMTIDPECAYLLNPGSIGQPRDGDPRASCAIYDSEGPIVTYCRIRYDVDSAARKIRDVGLPPILADRLSMGR